MMMQIQPLLAQVVDTERLAQGLTTHLAASGLPLPDDSRVLDHLRTAVRAGHARAALIVCDGAACGVAAWHRENGLGNITLLYALADVPVAAVRDLVVWVLDDLANKLRLDRAVTELPEALPQMRQVLAELDFVGAERILMTYDLSDPVDLPLLLADGYRLTPWQEGALDAAADVIYRSNIGTMDALLIPELGSLAATRNIVELTLQGRYGVFDRSASGLVFRGDETVGVTLVTRRGNGQGFTAEICVLPEHRRRGLARALMLHTQAAQQAAGLPGNMLGVTAGNPAYWLYHSLGYRPVGSVWSYVYPRPAAWQGMPE